MCTRPWVRSWPTRPNGSAFVSVGGKAPSPGYLGRTVEAQLGIDPDKRVDTALGRRMKLINDGTVVADMIA